MKRRFQAPDEIGVDASDGRHGWHPAAKVAAALIAVPVVVYTYKCTMLVLFQHELLYMRRLPFGARQRFDDAAPHGLKATDVILPRVGTRSQGPARWMNWPARDPQLHGLLIEREKRDLKLPLEVLVVYFQGNGGNVAHRHAKFQALLNTIEGTGDGGRPMRRAAMLAVGYRGYGLSRGRPTESGIIRDTLRFLNIIPEIASDPSKYGGHAEAAAAAAATTEATKEASTAAPPTAERPPIPPKVVLYGHSLGGAVALCALAHLRNELGRNSSELPSLPRWMPQLVVIENTFTSVAAMLKALYPRGSPFHYLTPFLRSHWDAEAALRTIVPSNSMATPNDPWQPPELAFISGARDEIVPPEMMRSLHSIAIEEFGCSGSRGGLNSSSTGRASWQGAAWYSVPDGLHNSTWDQPLWRAAWRDITHRLIVGNQPGGGRIVRPSIQG